LHLSSEKPVSNLAFQMQPAPLRRAVAAAALDELLPLAYMWSRGAEMMASDASSQRHCAKSHCAPAAGGTVHVGSS
jgi:hypothetical protein